MINTVQKIVLRPYLIFFNSNRLIFTRFYSSRCLFQPRYNAIQHIPVVRLHIHLPGFSCNERLKATMSTGSASSDPSRHLDYNQLLHKKTEPQVVLVDVREPAEINETGRLPGSIHIPLGEVENALGKLAPEEFKKKYDAEKPTPDKEVIFSCKAGGRSFKALEMAMKLGYENAKHYKGGWLDWAEKSKA